MAYIIGTDEAGYGPLLGPLVITATAWESSDRNLDLYRVLNDSVVDRPKDLRGSGKGHLILVADSKLACAGGKLGRLERTVLVLLKAIHGHFPATLAELVKMVMPIGDPRKLFGHFWLQDVELKLPLSQTQHWQREADCQVECFLRACLGNDVRLNRIESTIIQAPEFNTGVVNHGNKASLLSDRTLGLVAALIKCRNGKIWVQCDKHGGRVFYLPVIAKNLTRHEIETLSQSSQQSAYRWTEDNLDVEIRFTAKGEDQMAVAVASMVSKYVREVFMAAFNNYWQQAIPGVKPTKGYPQDAKRFFADIEKEVTTKGLAKESFWRNC